MICLVALNSNQVTRFKPSCSLHVEEAKEPSPSLKAAPGKNVEICAKMFTIFIFQLKSTANN